MPTSDLTWFQSNHDSIYIISIIHWELFVTKCFCFLVLWNIFTTKSEMILSISEIIILQHKNFAAASHTLYGGIVELVWILSTNHRAAVMKRRALIGREQSQFPSQECGFFQLRKISLDGVGCLTVHKIFTNCLLLHLSTDKRAWARINWWKSVRERIWRHNAYNKGMSP